MLDKSTLNFIHVLRAIAAFLIVNSHTETLFPENMRVLATGGSLGNAIFFFTSGYTLSLNIYKNTSFFQWIYKRIIRLYPSVLLFMIFQVLLFNVSYTTKDWLFFMGSWFLQAIFCAYFLIYPIIKFQSKNLKWLILLSYFLFVLWFLLNNHSFWLVDTMDNPTKLHWIYYIGIMLFGAYIGLNYNKERKNNNRKKISVDILLFFASVIIFYMPKLLVERFHITTYIQLLYPMLLMIATYFFFKMAQYISGWLRNLNIGWCNSAVIFIANLTLYIYIVHFMVIVFIDKINIIFPFNYMLMFIGTTCAAYVLNFFSNKLSHLALKLINSNK